jgi:hypothetical protein
MRSTVQGVGSVSSTNMFAVFIGKPLSSNWRLVKEAGTERTPCLGRTALTEKLEVSEMRKGRNYYVYDSEGKTAASQKEWAACVRAGKKGMIRQVVGVFASKNLLLEVFTVVYQMIGRPRNEWVSRAIDLLVIDLINPLFCPVGSTPEQIEAMHAQAVSKARAFLRIYVERSVHYTDNMVEGRDLRYLARTYDFAVDNFEEEREDEDS